jgi:hypothetical protein
VLREFSFLVSVHEALTDHDAQSFNPLCLRVRRASGLGPRIRFAAAAISRAVLAISPRLMKIVSPSAEEGCAVRRSRRRDRSDLI